MFVTFRLHGSLPVSRVFPPARLERRPGIVLRISHEASVDRICFSSARLGSVGIFRMRPDGSAVQQMTHGGAFCAPAITPDGKWLYYSVPEVKGLWKMPADGGEPTQVRATFFDVTGSIGERQADGYPRRPLPVRRTKAPDPGDSRSADLFR